MISPTQSDHWWREKHKEWQVAVANGDTVKSFAEYTNRANPPKAIIAEPLPPELRNCQHYKTVYNGDERTSDFYS